MQKILVVEDDIYLREEFENTFAKRGYSVLSISNFDSPERDILACNPDLVLLDINLPGKSGFELCKWLKARTTFPILIITARDTLSDELYALGLGADDYITKPCHPDRLVARAERLLRLYEKVRYLVQVEGLTLDIELNKVIWEDRQVILSNTESKILQMLIEHYPKVVSKQTLTHLLWGGDAFVDENILQVNMTRLRKSLETIELRDIVKTVRGEGYFLEVVKT